MQRTKGEFYETNFSILMNQQLHSFYGVEFLKRELKKEAQKKLNKIDQLCLNLLLD